MPSRKRVPSAFFDVIADGALAVAQGFADATVKRVPQPWQLST
jgi:hypothetical protein